MVYHRDFIPNDMFSNLAKWLCILTEHLEFELISREILNIEYAVRPPDMRRAAIPEEAVASIIEKVKRILVSRHK